jgi:hypothetical protein
MKKHQSSANRGDWFCIGLCQALKLSTVEQPSYEMVLKYCLLLEEMQCKRKQDFEPKIVELELV